MHLKFKYNFMYIYVHTIVRETAVDIRCLCFDSSLVRHTHTGVIALVVVVHRHWYRGLVTCHTHTITLVRHTHTGVIALVVVVHRHWYRGLVTCHTHRSITLVVSIHCHGYRLLVDIASTSTQWRFLWSTYKYLNIYIDLTFTNLKT